MKRGRPLKFGRPAQLLAIRLPENAVRALSDIHPDPAWAIVSLIDGESRRHRKTPAAAPPVVELVKVGRQSPIVVDQAAVKAIPGVDIIPPVRQPRVPRPRSRAGHERPGAGGERSAH